MASRYSAVTIEIKIFFMDEQLSGLKVEMVPKLQLKLAAAGFEENVHVIGLDHPSAQSCGC